jgi:hypothetical protein
VRSLNRLTNLKLDALTPPKSKPESNRRGNLRQGLIARPRRWRPFALRVLPAILSRSCPYPAPGAPRSKPTKTSYSAGREPSGTVKVMVRTNEK